MATIESFIASFGIDPSGVASGKAEVEKHLDQLRMKSAEVATAIKRLQIEQSKFSKGMAAGDQAATKEWQRLFGEIEKLRQEQRGFTQDINNTTTKLHEMGHAGAHAAEQMKEKVMELGKTLVGVFGVGFAIHEIGHFIHQTVEGSVAISRLSKEAHMGAEEIQAWQSAVKKYGGTAEGVNASIQGLGRQVSVLGTKLRGARMAGLAFAQMGLSEVQIKGKQTGEVLEILAKKMHGMEYFKALQLSQMFRMRDPGLIRAMVEGGEELEKALAKAKKNALGPEEIASMKEFHESMIEAKKALENLGRHLVVAITPALKFIAEKLQAIAAWARDHRAMIESMLIMMGVHMTMIASKALLATNAFKSLGIQAIFAGKSFKVMWAAALGPVGELLIAVGLLNSDLELLGSSLGSAGSGFMALLTGDFKKSGDKFYDAIYDLEITFREFAHWLGLYADPDKNANSIPFITQGGQQHIDTGKIIDELSKALSINRSKLAMMSPEELGSEDMSHLMRGNRDYQHLDALRQQYLHEIKLQKELVRHHEAENHINKNDFHINGPVTIMANDPMELSKGLTMHAEGH